MMPEAQIVSPPIEIISSQEFQEAWVWFLDYISINQTLVDEHGYFLDHKHWQRPDGLKCIDECENAGINLARLYLVSQLASVTDYLPSIKKQTFDFTLRYVSEHLDVDVARVVNAQETERNRNSFRDSLSEILAYWTVFPSIIKSPEYHDFSISKPNLQPEDKGPDGVACVVYDQYSIIKIISVKNSIRRPKSLVSSRSLRKDSDIVPETDKILDEFYAFQKNNQGFERVDNELNTLLQSLEQDAEYQIRWALLKKHSQFNASVIANEAYADRNLFEGFSRISEKPIRCIGIYVGSENWKDLADRVQIKVKEILTNKGILF